MEPEQPRTGNGPTGERRQRIEDDQALPWRQRPRRTAWQAAPKYKLTQVAFAFSYLGPCMLAFWAVRGWRPEEVGDNLGIAIVLCVTAVIETVFLVLWFRRPVRRSSATNPGQGGSPAG